jgi:hypothetical protein
VKAAIAAVSEAGEVERACEAGLEATVTAAVEGVTTEEEEVAINLNSSSDYY